MQKYTRYVRRLWFAVSVIFFFLIAGLILFWMASLKIPDLSSFEQRRVSESTKIYDRTGEILLYDMNKDIKRTAVSFDEISRNIKNAAVAIEDTEFYEHNGVRPMAFLRAVIANILSGELGQGGSTITQQVVKNSVLTREKKISRKIKEWVISIKLERVLSKEEILSLYLNESSYGGVIYGVEKASDAFFGKHASEVSLAEAAYLAAIPQSPTYYSPYGNNKGALEARKNLVLEKMLESSFITQEEFSSAKEEFVEFLPPSDVGIRAPHFVFYVIDRLEREYGLGFIENEGLKIITSLDYSLQEKAEEIVKRNALENAEKFNAENAGMVAVDPRTGEILVMVGSRDYFDEEIEGNFNVTLAHRQPGSSFKPFVYAAAFEKGYTPNTVVFDLETEFSTNCNVDGNPIDSTKNKEDVCYMPQNYDNIFRGPMTLRDALAQSVNIPAIKVLYLAGLSDSLRLAKEMGIRSLIDVGRYGLTLVLGGGEVSLLDMSIAYSVFANNGLKRDAVSILGVKDGEEVLIDNTGFPGGIRILDENIARKITDILSDDVARTPAFGERSLLYLEQAPVAVKTGTTNDYRDAWIIGYTPNIVVGSWAGNNDNSSMEKRVAGFIVAPMWNEFMQEVLKERDIEKFRGYIKDNPLSSPPIINGVWQGGIVKNVPGEPSGVVLDVHSILYWLDKDKPTELNLDASKKDPQFILWEYPVLKWAQSNGYHSNGGVERIIPVHNISGEIRGDFQLFGISEGQNISSSEKITLWGNTSQEANISRVEYFINGEYLGQSDSSPFYFSFVPNKVSGVEKENVLRFVVYDTLSNKETKSISFSVF
jgi:penicillin-binding protein 1C